MDRALFKSKDKVYLIDMRTKSIKKIGTIEYIRDDRWEQENAWPSGSYHYHVSYEDDSFETYENQKYLIHALPCSE